MEHAESRLPVLQDLKRMGVHLAVDDSAPAKYGPVAKQEPAELAVLVQQPLFHFEWDGLR